MLDIVSENSFNNDDYKLEKESVIDLVYSQNSNSSFELRNNAKRLFGIKLSIIKSNSSKNSHLAIKF